MSKVNSEVLKESIRSIFHDQKKRKFTETIELQIGLKNYDPTKDKRFSGSLQLPHPCKANMKFCLLGTELDCDKAEALGLEFKNVEMMKAYKKNKKVIKRMAKSYDAFLASQTLIRQIPRLLGRCFCGFLCKCAACAGVVSLPLSRGSLVLPFVGLSPCLMVWAHSILVAVSLLLSAIVFVWASSPACLLLMWSRARTTT
jgi:Ribosomal protein L1p/L10e family